jgi:hypothetical protein
MPRQRREKSELGLYHVMLKGLDGRNIFLQEGGRIRFLSQVRLYRESTLKEDKRNVPCPSDMRLLCTSSFL